MEDISSTDLEIDNSHLDGYDTQPLSFDSVRITMNRDRPITSIEIG